jgi:hypothetical protein
MDVSVGLVAERAEFEAVERLLVSPDPTLAKDGGSGTVETDCYPHRYEDGGQRNDPEDANRDVERPLAEFPRDRLGFMR